MSPRRPPPPPPPGKRAQQRADRRKRRRSRLGIGLGLAALLGALAVAVTSDGDSGKKQAGPSRTQHTLLLHVQQADRTALSSALIAHDSKTKQGSVVLIPPQVLAQVPGVGSLAFGKALSLGEATEAVTGTRNALADLLAVTVDGSWVLDVPTFRTLIDRLGGVQVTVDRTVLRGRTVLLTAGPQLLDGTRAELYATYLAEDEQEQARLARLQSVLDGVVSALPENPLPLLRALGPGSRSTLPVDALSDLLKGLKADNGSGDLQYRSLPVTTSIGTGDEVVFRIDAPAVKVMVSELLGASVPAGVTATNNRVLVLNGVGTPGLGAKVREKLVPAGFVFVGSRNAESFDYETTVVLIKDATTEGAALGARVAKALGVPASSVSTSNEFASIADVVVIVGKDFKAGK